MEAVERPPGEIFKCEILKSPPVSSDASAQGNGPQDFPHLSSVET